MMHINRVWHELNLIQFLCFSLFRFCELCKHRFEFAPSKSLSPSLSLSRSLSLILLTCTSHFSLIHTRTLLFIVICCPTLSFLSIQSIVMTCLSVSPSMTSLVESLGARSAVFDAGVTSALLPSCGSSLYPYAYVSVLYSAPLDMTRYS